MPRKKKQEIAKGKTQWLELFLSFIAVLSIDSKESGVGPLTLYGSQQRYLAELIDGLERDIHTFVFLKARQLGISTVALAVDLFWLIVHPGMQGAIVTDTDGNRDKFRIILTRMLASLPAAYKVEVQLHNRSNLVLGNGSTLDYLVAGTRKTATKVGISRAYNFLHACAAPGTPVITEHGRIKAIEDVRVGDKVLTHTGKAATVVDVLGQPNTKGKMTRITPWLGKSILCTEDHTIPTQRGIIETKDLRKDDLLLMPVRKICRKMHSVTLPQTRKGTGSVKDEQGRFTSEAEPAGKEWVRIKAAGAGAVVELTEEFGFFVGYYLAEGCLQRAWNGNFSAIVFTRHRDEAKYSDRAIDAIKHLTTGNVRTKDRENTLTTTVVVNCTPLAQWLADNFGGPWQKFIPDDVFDWGEDFCRGLLCGLLAGDGSKTVSVTKSPKREPASGNYTFRVRARAKDKSYGTNLVTLPTIHSSLATQARDIAASLGYGWGSLVYSPGREAHGRMCKPQWRVTWCGSAAFKLRSLVGLPVVPRAGRSFIEKYRIENGLVYLKIRKIEKGIEESVMWDISVDHDDHTFRTPYMAIGNTEISNFGAIEGIQSLFATLAQKHPDRLYMFESTARGFNLFYTLWQQARSDPMTQKAAFIGWWANEQYAWDENSDLYRRYWDGMVEAEEQERVNNVWGKYGVRITPQQIAWYRWMEETQSGGTGLMDQDYPWDEDDAFLQTGQTFFPMKRMVAIIRKLTDDPPPFLGYAYEYGESFMKTKIHSVREADDAELKIYEEPSEIGQYVIGVDPAYGDSDNADNSAIQVYRCYADKLVQVAEFASSNPINVQVAWVLAHLAGTYKNVMMIIELTGPGEATVLEMKHLRELFDAGALPIPGDGSMGDIFGNARWFMYHRSDSPGTGYVYNWKCLSVDTPLPTPSGWTTMKDVRIGDKLLDDRGYPCSVTGVSPVWENHECYQVTFDDGSSIIADSEHLWSVHRHLNKNWKDGSEKLRKTSQLLDKSKCAPHVIRIADPLVLPDVELAIHPYTLGVWLGDGMSQCGKYCASVKDIDEMGEHLIRCGESLAPAKDGGSVYFQNVIGLRGRLRREGLLLNKHIPEKYLRASFNQRLSLLQGLLNWRTQSSTQLL